MTEPIVVKPDKKLVLAELKALTQYLRVRHQLDKDEKSLIINILSVPLSPKIFIFDEKDLPK